MDKNLKMLPIDHILHAELKSYCKKNGLIMKSLIEKLIKNELSKDIRSNYKES
jgi:hypothetical protein